MDIEERYYIVKSIGGHQVLFFHPGVGFTWDAYGDWDRAHLFTSLLLAKRVARHYGAEAVEWRGEVYDNKY